MPKGTPGLHRPTDAAGRELITTEELSEMTGVSVWHIRERTRPNGRGKFIPSHKIGTRLWFEPEDAKQAIYDSRKRTPPVAQPKDIDWDDLGI